MNPIHVTRQYSLYSMFSERAIQARQHEMARLSEQLGTTKRINRASDDPAAYSQARRMEVLGDRYAQYQRSIDSARTWSSTTQQALDKLADLFTAAHENGLQAANGTLQPSDYEVVAKQLESTLAEVLDMMNTKAGDEYVFAGSRTTVEPFTINGGGAVDYNGNDNGRKRTIGQDATLDINLSGDRLYATGAGLKITDSLQNLIQAVRNQDQTAMTTALKDVAAARDHVIDLGAESGIIGNRLDLAEEQLADALLLVESRRSDLEDADVAEVIMQFQREQTGLQAALKSAAVVLQTSILDYL